jgi:hypothetical protein
MRSKLVAALSGLVLLCSACATTSPARHDPAVVQSVSGRAEISVAGERWRIARTGAKLPEGAIVRTGPASHVNLSLGTHRGVLTVHPDSTLELERLGPSAGDPAVAAVLNLAQGRVTGDTRDLPARMKIVVKTLGGVHEIR